MSEPVEQGPAEKPARTRLRVDSSYTEWLEQACDEVNAKLQPLHSFVIPGGTPAAAHLHVARTVCRRAERRAIAVGEEGNPEVVRYLNRLSDLLFILSRAATRTAREEPLWDPGAHSASANPELIRADSPRRTACRADRPRAGRPPRAPSTATPADSHRGCRWACARQGSTVSSRPPRRTRRRAPRRLGAATSGRRAPHTERAPPRRSRARSATRRGRCTCSRPGHGNARVAASASRRSAAQSAITHATASATRGRPRKSAHAINSTAHSVKSAGSSRSSMRFATASRCGRLSSVKSCRATASRTCATGTNTATIHVSASPVTHSPAMASALAALGSPRLLFPAAYRRGIAPAAV